MSPSYRTSTGFSLGGSLSTIVRLLIAWNVILFFVQKLSGSVIRGLDVDILFNLGLVPRDLFRGHVWQLVTYMFLHGGWVHIGMNMLALWMFGSELEYLWGARRFVQYYFFCGIGAGITNAVFQPHSLAPVVGASGAIFGLLLAFGMYFPNRPILIYFLFPMPAKYFVIVFGAMEFFASITPGRDGVAHLAHLGGLVFGLIYLKTGVWRWLSRSGRPRRRRQAKIIDLQSYRDRDDEESRWR